MLHSTPANAATEPEVAPVDRVPAFPGFVWYEILDREHDTPVVKVLVPIGLTAAVEAALRPLAAAVAAGLHAPAATHAAHAALRLIH